MPDGRILDFGRELYQVYPTAIVASLTSYLCATTVACFQNNINVCCTKPEAYHAPRLGDILLTKLIRVSSNSFVPYVLKWLCAKFVQGKADSDELDTYVPRH